MHTSPCAVGLRKQPPARCDGCRQLASCTWEAPKKGDDVEEPVRDEVLMGLVYRARTDPEFKRNIRAALDRLLIDEYRYDLTEEELAMCRDFWSQTVGLTDEELDERLAALADPIHREGI